MSDLNQDVCPICNSLDTENFYDYGLFQFPTWKRYLLNLICKNCGQVFLSKNSAYNEIDDYYADYALKKIATRNCKCASLVSRIMYIIIKTKVCIF